MNHLYLVFLFAFYLALFENINQHHPVKPANNVLGRAKMKGLLSVLLASLSANLVCQSLLADESGIFVPDAIRTNAIAVSTNLPTSARFMPAPGLPDGSDYVSSDSPSVSTNFDGGDDAALYYPPDTIGAVGTNRLLVMLNGVVKIQDRSGTTISSTNLNGWWNSLGPFSDAAQNYVFDPHVQYDPYKDRWIAIAVANAGSATSEFLIGVSATSDPAGTWYRYGVLADTRGFTWADFPLVGFNKDKVVVTYTLASVTNNFPDDGTGMFVFDKATLYAGTTPVNGSTYSYMHLDGAAFGYVLVPAITLDTNQATMYLVETLNANFNNTGYLVVYAVGGTAGSPTIVTNGFPQAAAWKGIGDPASGQQNFLPQLGTAQKIDSLDHRMGQVVYRFGSLWCAHTIFLPKTTSTHSLIQWWQLDPSNGNAVQRGVIEDTSAVTNYAYPSIAINQFKDVMIGFSSFSSSQYVSANYAFHACGDQSGTMQAPALLKLGISAYRRTNNFLGNTDLRNRWGDFSATMVDPRNDTDLWTIQEYAAQYVGGLTNGSGRWGTWWGTISPTLPGNDSFTNFYTLTDGEGTTNGTVLRATRESGEPNHGGNANTPSVWYRWTAPANGNVTFSATNNGSANLTLALAAYTGSTVSALTLKTNATGPAPRIIFNAVSNTTYQIAVAGLNGSCGAFALQFIQPTPPRIVQQPTSTNVVANASENATLSSMAIGAPDPVFQWKFYGTNTSPTTNAISGATNAAYTITNVQGTNAGNYFVIATNSSGSATSAVATLFVHGDSAARQSPVSFTTNKFWFQIWGLTNRAYRVETSTNLVDWSPIFTNYVSYWYTNTGTTNDAQRFYRSITNN